MHLVSRTILQVKDRNVFGDWKTWKVKFKYVHLVSRSHEQAKYRNVYLLSGCHGQVEYRNVILVSGTTSTEQVKYRNVNLVYWIDIEILDVYYTDLYELHEVDLLV